MQKAIQELPMSESRLRILPKKWQPKYYLKRIGEDDLVISWETRSEILNRLAGNVKYIQIGEFTIMLNAIKEMAPYWPPNNIPPRPKLTRTEKLLDTGTYSVTENDD